MNRSIHKTSLIRLPVDLQVVVRRFDVVFAQACVADKNPQKETPRSQPHCSVHCVQMAANYIFLSLALLAGKAFVIGPRKTVVNAAFHSSNCLRYSVGTRAEALQGD